MRHCFAVIVFIHIQGIMKPMEQSGSIVEAPIYLQDGGVAGNDVGGLRMYVPVNFTINT